MATIDINQYIEQSGMRKARFGGYEPDDVRQAMLDLCSDYEQRLNTAAQQVRGAQQEAEALRRRCQTLIGQNQNLATQNASLAGKADRIARMQSDMETRYSKVQERNHSLTDQVAMLRLKNTDLELKNKELTEPMPPCASKGGSMTRPNSRCWPSGIPWWPGRRKKPPASAARPGRKLTNC